MPWTSEHTKWFFDTKKRIKTACGKDVEVWEFRHQKDDRVLRAWAKHFRNHYCLDGDIDYLRGQKSRQTYLDTIKFPSLSGFGPSVRAGDFGEILVTDYLQWILKCWVPRVRWSGKVIKDESAKGSDVIGFKLFDGKKTAKDVLFVIESKTKFSANNDNRLQDAINDSAKDHVRIDESLNYIKQRAFDKGNLDDVIMVERFQSPVDLPYQENYGAVALYCNDFFEESEITKADSRKIPKGKKKKKYIVHPKSDRLKLIVITGEDMMNLVHELYRRAASEA